MDNQPINIAENNKIGMVFQNPVSFSWLKVLENVEFGLKMQGVKEDKRKEIAKHFIDLVGLSGYENNYIKTLSGGMKQRVAIATVLASNPEVLLMDEPFSALDPQTRGLMQELILSVWEETKKTVLFVTHDIDEAIFLADRVYVMSSKPGRIKEVINIDIPRPRYSEIKFSDEFLKIKKHISYVIRGEAIKAAQVSLSAIRPKALKIGTTIWPGNMPLYLAKELGLFNKYNLDVELMSKEEDKLASLENKEIDVIHMTTESIPISGDKNLGLKVFLCMDESFGGDALLARNNIKSISELKGKKIAIENNSSSQFFLLHALEKKGLNKEDVDIIYMKSSDIGAAMISETIDAAVLWEPWLTSTKKLCNGRILVSTKEDPVIFDVLAANKNILDSRSAELKKLVKIWFESLDYIKREPEKSIKLMSIPLGISAKELKEQMQTLRLSDKRFNLDYLGTKNKSGKILVPLKDATDILFKNNIISKKVPESDLIDNSIINSVD